MNVVVVIEGREAIPVRVIPLLTCWQTMTPDALALALAGDEHFDCFKGVQAHRATGGKALKHAWWTTNVVKPHRALKDKLKAAEVAHETGLQNFRSESLKMLPGGVYVWRDEFEQAHQRHFIGTTLTVDYEGKRIHQTDSEIGKLPAAHNERIALDFSPLITAELYVLVMDGFLAGAEPSGSTSRRSEKWRLLWQAVSFDENRVKAAMNELEQFPPKGISEIAVRDEKRASLQAELTQIAGRKDWLAMKMSVDAQQAAERLFTVKEMVESRQPLSVEDAIARTCEIEAANKEIDLLIAQLQNDAPEQGAAKPTPVVAKSASVEHAEEPRAAATGPKFSMTRSALIDAHKHEWPTIQADIKEAAATGLDAAKAGPRGWDEKNAMEWARAKGKLKNSANPVDALTQGIKKMASLPGRTHTLGG